LQVQKIKFSKDLAQVLGLDQLLGLALPDSNNLQSETNSKTMVALTGKNIRNCMQQMPMSLPMLLTLHQRVL
jgi:hypothetical protein